MDLSEKIVAVLKLSDRPMKIAELSKLGFNRVALHRLAEAGTIERAGTGVYRLPDYTSEYADWAALALRHSHAVVCTLSAASFHRTTQEMPAKIHVAIPHGSEIGSGNFPVGIEAHKWRTKRNTDAFTLGVEEHVLDNVPVRITDPERTLVDMFRYSSLNRAIQSDASHVDPETFLDCLQKTIGRREFLVERLDSYIEAFGNRREIGPYVQGAMYSMSSVPFEN